MEGFNWSTVLWIVGLVFVYVFGLYEGRSQGRKRRIAEEQQEKKDNPSSKPEAVKVDDPGLLRIKNENNVMTLDLDGQRVDPTALNADQRKRLIEMLNVMRPWLEGKSAAVPSPIASPPPQPQTASAPNTLPAPQSATITPTTPAKTATTGKKKGDEAETTPTSIVAQINMVLQQRIANSPLESRGVTLMESPTGGVNVYIGVQRYEAIDDVPDEEVKAAIRAAIAEWEKKFTPGL
jgi:hypothetical protein